MWMVIALQYHEVLKDLKKSNAVCFIRLYRVVQKKPLLRFSDRFFRVGTRFENNLNKIAICVILSVYGESFITNSACIAKISIFA